MKEHGQRQTMRLVPCVVFAFVFYLIPSMCAQNCRAQSGDHFHSEVNGYSLLIPAEWVQIPHSSLEAAYNQAVSAPGAADFYWEAAFGETITDASFQCPYVIVQVMPYSNLGWSRQPRKDEIGMILEAFTGLDVDQIADRTLASNARKSLLDLRPGEVVFREGSTSYSLGLEMKRAEGKKIRALMAGHFGRTSIVQLMFYDLFDNWQDSRPERDCVFNSFRFDPHMAYDEGRVSRPSVSKSFNRIFAKGVGGGLVAAGLCVVIALFRLAASTIKTKPTCDSKEEDNGSDIPRTE